MTIRYERRGLRVVRAGQPAGVEAPPPAREEYPTAGLERAAALLERAASGLRADARRRRTWRVAPRQGPRTVSGDELRRARGAAGLSQRDLARELSVSRGLVAEIERGVRSCPPEVGEWAKGALGALREQAQA